jgi:uracil-DNA glycosylase family 4
VVETREDLPVDLIALHTVIFSPAVPFSLAAVVAEVGAGWPGDLATRSTPVANSPDDVGRLAGSAPSLEHLTARSTVCRACPRLVTWREKVAEQKRAAYDDEPYWGRPVGAFGSDRPKLLIVGLAPAAHGGNRTGRVFTGDRSGDWLFAALHRAGLARRPTSVAAGDRQHLGQSRIVAAVRCAPPSNKPTPAERDTCGIWLQREVTLTASTVRVAVALGGFAWAATFDTLAAAGYALPSRRPRFGHCVEVEGTPPPGHRYAPESVTLIGCYHPSQQNTFTGKLTVEMLDQVFGRAAELIGVRSGVR